MTQQLRLPPTYEPPKTTMKTILGDITVEQHKQVRQNPERYRCGETDVFCSEGGSIHYRENTPAMLHRNTALMHVDGYK